MWNRISRDNAVAPAVSLTEVKRHVRVDSTDEDLLLGRLSAAATLQIETRTGTTFTDTAFTMRLHSFPVRSAGLVHLMWNPVVSINSVQYVDEAGVTQTVSSSNYEVDSMSGLLRPKEDQEWPDTDEVLNAVTIKYTAGRTGSMDDLKSAVLLLIGSLYRYRESHGEPPNGYIEMPVGVEMLIAPYVKGRFGA